MKKPQFITNAMYHIYNRGVEKRALFMDARDYLRFINDLREFNDTEPALPSNVRLKTNKPRTASESVLEVQPLKIKKQPLVDMLCFCLMPNHFHLLVRQREENGIVAFMQKLGTGYTVYFNLKYQRVGALFQGRFKAAHVEKEAHLQHLIHYIHCNPLQLIEPAWKEKRVGDRKKALMFLESYRWSSYPDIIGKKNFPLVISPAAFEEFFGEPRYYKKAATEWLRGLDFEDIPARVLAL